ncbi:MAG: SCP2 sterol-binding domain-containing protein [Myxococcota bacterium]
MEPSVHLSPGADNNGFAVMLAQLIRQNIDDRPEKKEAMGKMTGRVALVVEDLSLAVTLRFEEGRLTVHDGVVGIPDLTVRAPSEWHTRMSLVELEPRLGLPNPRGDVAREVFEASRRGDVKVYGMFTSLPLMLRLTQVMSVV